MGAALVAAFTAVSDFAVANVGLEAASAIGTGLEGAAVGAGLGGIQAGITGGNIGDAMAGGALGGAITGGLAGPLGSEVGSEIGGGVLAGGLGGLANAGVTGGNLGTGALMGGAAGGVMGALGGGSPTTPGTGGESAVATAAPEGVGAPPVDLTAGQGDSNWAATNTTSDTGVVKSATLSSGMQGSSSPTANLPQTGGDVPPAMVGASAGIAPQQGLWGQITSGAQDFFTPSNPTPVNVATDLGLPTAGTPYSGLPTTGSAAQGSDFNWGSNTPASNPSVSTGANAAPQIGNVSPGADQINANTNTLSAQNTPYATTSSGTNAPPVAPASGGGGQGGGAAPFDYGKSTVGGIANSLGIPENAITTAIAKNPGVVLGALGLGGSALVGQQQPKGYNQLIQEAQALAAQGGQLQNALNGTLPAGAQAQLNQAANSAKAEMRSKFAQMGLSGSTMEAQSIANLDQQIAAQGYNMMMSLYNAGVQESGMANELFTQIMQMNQAQSQGLSSAVSNFAGALAGGGNNGQSIRILAGNS